MKDGSARYDFIDALRGLAVAGVVLVHTGRQAMPPSDLLRTAMNLGASGVHLFFVVSALTKSCHSSASPCDSSASRYTPKLANPPARTRRTRRL